MSCWLMRRALFFCILVFSSALYNCRFTFYKSFCLQTRSRHSTLQYQWCSNENRTVNWVLKKNNNFISCITYQAVLSETTLISHLLTKQRKGQKPVKIVNPVNDNVSVSRLNTRFLISSIDLSVNRGSTCPKHYEALINLQNGSREDKRRLAGEDISAVLSLSGNLFGFYFGGRDTLKHYYHFYLSHFHFHFILFECLCRKCGLKITAPGQKDILIHRMPLMLCLLHLPLLSSPPLLASLFEK